METGWISIHRKLQENRIWLREPFTWGQAWVDLILLANHKPKTFFIRGIEINVKRGQLAWSMKRLGSRWSWSRTKVSHFLKYLEKEHQIRHQKTKVTTLISIINYDHYQDREQQKEQQKDIKKTSKRHQKDINNNDNNDNNDNKKHIPKKKHGEFKNVLLTDEQCEKLKSKFNSTFQERIENLSIGIASKGYKYKSHYHAILAWAKKDTNKPEKATSEKIDPKNATRTQRLLLIISGQAGHEIVNNYAQIGETTEAMQQRARIELKRLKKG